MPTETERIVAEALGDYPSITGPALRRGSTRNRYFRLVRGHVAARLQDRGLTLAEISDVVGYKTTESVKYAIRNYRKFHVEHGPTLKRTTA